MHQDQKVKRSHHEKRLYKAQQAQQATQKPVPAPAPTSNVVSAPEYEHHRENAKQVRNTRAPPTPQTKKLGEGHYHDRRSGTGRVYIESYPGTSHARRAEVGATSATSRTSSTATSTSRTRPKSPPRPRNPPATSPLSSPPSRPSPRSPRPSPSRSTTRTRAWRSLRATRRRRRRRQR